MRSQSGREKIRELFAENPDEWIPLPRILRLGVAQYNARILELRAEGLDIVNETEYFNGTKRSKFKYRRKDSA